MTRTGLIVLLICLSGSIIAENVVLPNTTQPAATISPVCLEPRATGDPSGKDIAAALNNTDAVANACNTTLRKWANDGNFSGVYYREGEYFFSVINRDGQVNLLQEPTSYCVNMFQGIIDACIMQRIFWGGSVQVDSAIWGVQNFLYPQNPLPLPMPTESGSASAARSQTSDITGSSLAASSAIVWSSSGTLGGISASTSNAATATLTSSGSPETTKSHSSGASSRSVTVSMMSEGVGSSSASRDPATGGPTTDTGSARGVTTGLSKTFSSSSSSWSSASSAEAAALTGSSAAPASTQNTVALSTGAPLSVYTVGGIAFTGNPTSLVAGTITLIPGGPAVTSSGHTIAFPTSAISGQIEVDGTPTVLPAPNIVTNAGTSTNTGTGPLRALFSTYTIAGFAFTGNPTSLARGSTTLTPGGSPLTMSGHTLAIPASVTGGVISVDGRLITLPVPTVGVSSQSATVAQTTGPRTIVPDYSITGAFAAGLTTTTLTDSGGGVLIYTMNTFADLATITGAPIIVHTHVIEALSDGSLTTFIGGIIVGPGGRWWGPPGLPKIEISPLGLPKIPKCIWPFCPPEIDDNGGGGGDPGGVAPAAIDPPKDPAKDPEKQSQPDNDPTKTHNQSDEEPSATSLQTITSAASSAATTALSCTMSTTVSDCNVICNRKRLRVRQAQSMATQSCTTTCYSTVTGCNITGTTTTMTSSVTSSGTPIQHIILPEETATIDDVKSIYKFLSSTFDADTLFVFIPENSTIVSDSMFIIPWDIQTQPGLTDDQIAKIAAQPGVATVVANSRADTDLGVESTASAASSVGSPTLDPSTFTLPESAARVTPVGTVSEPRRKAKRTAAPLASGDADQNHTTENFLQKRDGSYLRQVDPAAWQLKVVSQPTDAATVDFIPHLDYIYDDNQGEGTYNYLVGSGVRMDHQEWHGGAVVSNDWLWGPSYPRRSQQRVDDSEYGHETCIGSMITGETIGVSKAVTLYPVQVQWDMAAFLWIFSAISDDIARRRRRGSFRSGYITIYFPGYANQDFMNIYPNEFPRVRRRMQRLLDDDIIIITTAGNYAQVPGRENVDMFPGIWSSNTFPIIVVGSSDENGVKSFYSQAGNLVDVWAPGEAVRCASNENLDGYVIVRGDCFSAAVVNGLTNYWLSYRRPPFHTRHDLANEIKQFYRTDFRDGGGSYVRTGGNVRVIWNLIDGYGYNRPQAEKCDTANTRKKRDGSPACTLTSASTGITTSRPSSTYPSSIATSSSPSSSSAISANATITLPDQDYSYIASALTDVMNASLGVQSRLSAIIIPCDALFTPTDATESADAAEFTGSAIPADIADEVDTIPFIYNEGTMPTGSAPACVPASRVATTSSGTTNPTSTGKPRTLAASTSYPSSTTAQVVPSSSKASVTPPAPTSIHAAPAVAPTTYTCTYTTSIGSVSNAGTTLTQTTTCPPFSTNIPWYYQCGASTYENEKVYYAACTCTFVSADAAVPFTSFNVQLHYMSTSCPATTATATATSMTLQSAKAKAETKAGKPLDPGNLSV